MNKPNYYYKWKAETERRQARELYWARRTRARPIPADPTESTTPVTTRILTPDERKALGI